jgi:hypothetical protein
MDQAENDQLEAVFALVSVCGDHFEDPFVREWVTAQATRQACTYCGAPKAADALDVAGLVLNGLRYTWASQIDELGGLGIGYDSALSTRELISRENVSSDPHYLDDWEAAMPAGAWVQRDFFRLPRADRLPTAWGEFKHYVRHEARYFFGFREPNPLDRDDVSAVQLLAHIGEVLQRESLVVEWSCDTDIYRARQGDVGQEFVDSWELSAAPVAAADRVPTNRMSAAGVPLFYGASTSGAAIAEMTSAAAEAPATVSLGRFRPTRPLSILDLSSGLDVPSPFDPVRGSVSSELEFLAEFLAEIALPVTRDGSEHVAYVPTQVICEFFRSQYRTKEGHSIDGIAYPSSQDSAAVNVCLFVANDEVENADGTRKPRPESERWLGPTNIGPTPILRLLATDHF